MGWDYSIGTFRNYHTSANGGPIYYYQERNPITYCYIIPRKTPIQWDRLIQHLQKGVTKSLSKNDLPLAKILWKWSPLGDRRTLLEVSVVLPDPQTCENIRLVRWWLSGGMSESKGRKLTPSDLR